MSRTKVNVIFESVFVRIEQKMCGGKLNTQKIGHVVWLWPCNVSDSDYLEYSAAYFPGDTPFTVWN